MIWDNDDLPMIRGPPRIAEYRAPPPSFIQKILIKLHLRKDPLRYLVKDWHGDIWP